MAPPNADALAQRLRDLCIPGTPLLLTNIYDAATATIVASHPQTKALATASYAIAATHGLADNALDLETNLSTIRTIARVAAEKDLPLTADLQDGYADVADTITRAIEAGAVGCNLEDADNSTSSLRSVEEAVARIETALAAASAAGVPSFCLNARTDVLLHDGGVRDAIARGKAYLAAGATTVFVWGGGRGVSGEEVGMLVEGLGGRVNVKMNAREGFLSAGALAERGVARISVGPELFLKAMEGFRGAVEAAVEGRGVGDG